MNDNLMEEVLKEDIKSEVESKVYVIKNKLGTDHPDIRIKFSRY